MYCDTVISYVEQIDVHPGSVSLTVPLGGRTVRIISGCTVPLVRARIAFWMGERKGGRGGTRGLEGGGGVERRYPGGLTDAVRGMLNDRIPTWLPAPFWPCVSSYDGV